MKTLINLLCALAVVAALLAGGSAVAGTSYWTDPGTGYGGNFTNAAQWTPGLPAVKDTVFFTNRQASAYTVQFTGSTTTGPLRLLDDSVTYDLNGYTWTVDPYGTSQTGSLIGTNGGGGNTYITMVKFSSSSTNKVVNGNFANFGTDPYHADSIGYGASTGGAKHTQIVVDDSLGYPVKFTYAFGSGSLGQDVSLLVSGPGSEFNIGFANGGNFNGVALVTNNAIFSGYNYGVGSAGTVNVINASMKTLSVSVGAPYSGGRSLVSLKNSTWTDGGTLYLGYSGLGGNVQSGAILLDNSTYAGQSIVFGQSHNGPGPGLLQILNGSSVIMSNSLLISSWNQLSYSNLVVMNNGTIALGGGAVGGLLSNASIVRLAGTIKGVGTTPALVYSENGSRFEVGSSIGQLVLSNANLQTAAGSKTFFEFSDTGLDQIVDAKGWVRLQGTNLFSLVAGSPAPTNGVKYGLGIYDFVIATNNNISAPQYDNLVNLLTNNYHLVYGVDFQYGVVNLGGGLFALELAFVPEPSTVLLLALGGLLAWRRIAKRGRKTGKAAGALIAGALILALAGGSALAATSNFWQGVAGGNYTNTANWSSGVAPTTTDFVYFTNGVTQQVQFTGSWTNKSLMMHNNSMTFDLNGYNWQNTATSFVGEPGSQIGTNGGAPMTVHFSASQGPQVGGGNVVVIGDSYYYADNLAGPTTILVDNTLGAPVKLSFGAGSGGVGGQVKVVVSGPGSEFSLTSPNAGQINGFLLVTNGATFSAPSGYNLGWYGGLTTTMVIGASMKTAGGYVGGYTSQGTVVLSNNSTWTASGHIQVGYDGYGAGPYRGNVIIDQSTYNGQGMTLGSSDGNPVAPGQLYLLNGSTMTLSNSLRISEVYPGQNTTLGINATNRFIMKDSTLYVGGGAGNGGVTNYGLVRASGTITGQGPGNFTFYNGFFAGTNQYTTVNYWVTNAAVVEIGSSIGKLTLNKGNLVMDPQTKLYLEFSDTGLDQVLAPQGFVTLAGSNIFSLVAGSPAPTNGVKYGLGVYDFVIATNNNISAPQYDNLVNLLTNNYHLTYGVDFQYGVVNLGGGLFALELAFVPEPSTVLLLALGGLMVWRRAAKKTSRKNI